MDALADITAVCLLLERLAPEQIIVSPVHVGSGHVRCAHGILPVPAPATAILLRGVPIYGGHIAGELCTPTGAALLTQFAARFGDMPPMRIERIGYGMGRKDFPAANCVRALLGETEDSAEDVLELACNLDDMTPEAIGFALERLLEAGALDAHRHEKIAPRRTAERAVPPGKAAGCTGSISARYNDARRAGAPLQPDGAAAQRQRGRQPMGAGPLQAGGRLWRFPQKI